jgi:hypothetical protein
MKNIQHFYPSHLSPHSKNFKQIIDEFPHSYQMGLDEKLTDYVVSNLANTTAISLGEKDILWRLLLLRIMETRHSGIRDYGSRYSEKRTYREYTIAPPAARAWQAHFLTNYPFLAGCFWLCVSLLFARLLVFPFTAFKSKKEKELLQKEFEALPESEKRWRALYRLPFTLLFCAFFIYAVCKDEFNKIEKAITRTTDFTQRYKKVVPSVLRSRLLTMLHAITKKKDVKNGVDDQERHRLFSTCYEKILGEVRGHHKVLNGCIHRERVDKKESIRFCGSL